MEELHIFLTPNTKGQQKGIDGLLGMSASSTHCCDKWDEFQQVCSQGDPQTRFPYLFLLGQQMYLKIDYSSGSAIGLGQEDENGDIIGIISYERIDTLLHKWVHTPPESDLPCRNIIINRAALGEKYMFCTPQEEPPTHTYDWLKHVCSLREKYRVKLSRIDMAPFRRHRTRVMSAEARVGNYMQE